MTTIIRLDGQALTSLINSDPEFKLELQRAVVAEALRKTIMRDVKPVVESLSPTLLAEFIEAAKDDAVVRNRLDDAVQNALTSVRRGISAYTVQREPKPEVQEILNKEVSRLSEGAINKALGRVDVTIERIVNEVIKRVESRIETHIVVLVEHKIGERINRGVEERLDAIKAAL